MKDKILALLMAKFTGVRKDGLAQLAGSLALQADKDEDATALIDKLTPEKVSEFVTGWRRDVDKEVSDANKTYEGNLKKKYDFKEKAEPGKTDPPAPGDPADLATLVANAVKAAVEPLQQKLSSFEGQKVTETRLQQLEGKLKDLPETFKTQKMKDFKRMNFDTNETFAEYLTEVETDITGFKQEMADKGLSGQARPIMGGQNKDGVSAGVASFIESKTKPATTLTGKEL